MKSQLEEQKLRLEKAHSDEMEQLLQKVMDNSLCIFIAFFNTGFFK